jgi:hypothetical protein
LSIHIRECLDGYVRLALGVSSATDGSNGSRDAALADLAREQKQLSLQLACLIMCQSEQVAEHALGAPPRAVVIDAPQALPVDECGQCGVIHLGRAELLHRHPKTPPHRPQRGDIAVKDIRLKNVIRSMAYVIPSHDGGRDAGAGRGRSKPGRR